MIEFNKVWSDGLGNIHFTCRKAHTQDAFETCVMPEDDFSAWVHEEKHFQETDIDSTTYKILNKILTNDYLNKKKGDK